MKTLILLGQIQAICCCCWSISMPCDIFLKRITIRSFPWSFIKFWRLVSEVMLFRAKQGHFVVGGGQLWCCAVNRVPQQWYHNRHLVSILEAADCRWKLNSISMSSTEQIWTVQLLINKSCCNLNLPWTIVYRVTTTL